MNSFKSNAIKGALIICLMTLLSACGDDGVFVSVNFSSAQGVQKGTAVYYEERRVGEVVAVKALDAGSNVTLSIGTDDAAKIDPNSAVVVNRIKPGSPLEIYSTADASVVAGLTSGQELKGLNSMFELVAWSVGDAIDVGSQELSGYVDSFQQYLESDDFEEDKAQVREGVQELAGNAKDAVKVVEADLVKAINEVLLSEGELAVAIDELGTQLSPLAEEMAKSGGELMVELERLTQSLESATTEEQEAGKALMDSLLGAIEKINEGVERGAEEGLRQSESVDAEVGVEIEVVE